MTNSESRTRFKLIVAEDDKKIDMQINRWIENERPVAIQSWQYVRIEEMHDRILIAYEKPSDDIQVKEWDLEKGSPAEESKND